MQIYVVLSNGYVVAAFLDPKKAEDYMSNNSDETYARMHVQPIQVQDMQHYPSSM